MAYEKSNAPVKYTFGLLDFGTGSAQQFAVAGPKGKRGLLLDYGVEGSIEAFSATTNAPSVSVGTSADADAYGDEFSVNSLAINSAKSVRSTYDYADAGFATYMLDRTLPADTAVSLWCNPGTGTPTGQAYPFMTILWDD
jgi:hypothetical protein